MTKIFFFDLLRFGGGKGGTTVTQSYEPTPFELALQGAEYEYSMHILPHAKTLSNDALNHLQKSGAEIPVNYAELFVDADGKIATGLYGILKAADELLANAPPTMNDVQSVVTTVNAQYLSEVFNYNSYYLTDGGQTNLRAWMDDIPKELYTDLRDLKTGLLSFTQKIIDDYEAAADDANGKLNALPAKFTDAANNTNDSLTAIEFDAADKANANYGSLGGLVPKFTDAADNTNRQLADIDDKVDDKAATNYQDLDNLIPKFRCAADKINLKLDALDDDAAEHMTQHHDNFTGIIPHFIPAANKTNVVLEDLETGKVPSQWQINMHDSIRLALENTIGKVVNDHGQRGVLNSSVTNQALYDIERNASDEVAQQYLANIHEIAGMAEQRRTNTEAALNDMKNSYNEQLGGYLNGIGQRGQIKQNEFNNLNTALVNQGNTFNSQFGNASNALNQQSQLEETSHNNLITAYTNQANTLN